MAKKKNATDDISYESAAAYLDKLTDPSLISILSKHTGGTWDADQIKKWKKEGENAKEFSGLMIWFCLNNDSHLLTEFFLLLEPKFDFNYEEEVNNHPDLTTWRPQNIRNLIKPGQHFKEKIYDIKDKEKFLKGHKLPKNSKDSKEDSINVDHWISAFLNEDDLGKKHKVPFSYFSKNGDESDINTDLLDEFFGQSDVVYMRYYIGFDPDITNFPLRVILVPVGEDGKNIDKSSKLSGTVLLQKSWPPPPNQ